MGAILHAVILSLLTLGAASDAPKGNDFEAALFPLPPVEVQEGAFEKWQKEAAKNSGVAYIRVEYDKKVFWVVDAHNGIGNAYKKVAVYAPKKEGTFRRCLLIDLEGAANLGVAVDPKTGVLELREQANSRVKGEVVLSLNLKVAGTGMFR